MLHSATPIRQARGPPRVWAQTRTGPMEVECHRPSAPDHQLKMIVLIDLNKR